MWFSSLAQISQLSWIITVWMTDGQTWEGSFPAKRCWADRRPACAGGARSARICVDQLPCPQPSHVWPNPILFPESPENFLLGLVQNQKKEKDNYSRLEEPWVSRHCNKIKGFECSASNKWLAQPWCLGFSKKSLFFKTDSPLQLKWRL